MIKLIIIAGLLFSHSAFAASEGRKHLGRIFSCDKGLRSDLSSDRAALYSKIKRLFGKYELLSTVMGGDYHARLKMSEVTLMATMRSLVMQINDLRDQTPSRELEAKIDGLEIEIDDAMTPNERNSVRSVRFSASGKARMETRAFEEDWSSMQYPELKPPQQQTRPIRREAVA
mgnify:CR=1 FL=1